MFQISEIHSEVEEKEEVNRVWMEDLQFVVYDLQKFPFADFSRLFFPPM